MARREPEPVSSLAVVCFPDGPSAPQHFQLRAGRDLAVALCPVVRPEHRLLLGALLVLRQLYHRMQRRRPASSCPVGQSVPRQPRLHSWHEPTGVFFQDGPVAPQGILQRVARDLAASSGQDEQVPSR